MTKAARLSNESICIICECHKERGIRLYQSFICHDCEMEMIRTDTSDPKYHHYLKQLKKITKPEILY